MKEMILGDLRLAPTGRTVRVMGQSATKTADLRGQGSGVFRECPHLS